MNTSSYYSDREAYATFMSQQEPPLLAALRATTKATIHGSQMLSSPLQGRILSFLSHLIRPQKVLEVGTYTGYSTLCLGEGLAAQGRLHTIDRHYYPLVEEYLQKANLHQQATYHIGLAHTIIPKIAGPFDMIWLDADKKQYSHYAELLLPQLRVGGVILADNILWKGAVLSPSTCEQDPRAGAMRQLALEWKDNPCLAPLLLPIGDGLLIAQKISR
ncbi:MAG: O-methyltransferase [Bacteroidota bacterium]